MKEQTLDAKAETGDKKRLEIAQKVADALNLLNDLFDDPFSEVNFLGDIEGLVGINEGFRFTPNQNFVKTGQMVPAELTGGKVKVRTREFEFNQAEIQINNAINVINTELRMAVEAIGFQPSANLLKDCLNRGDAITQEFHERLRKDLSILSIPSSKKLFEESAMEGLRNFHTARQNVVNQCPSNIRKHITFEGEIAVFSNESREQLQEDFSVYLTDQEEIDLYYRHVQATHALNNFFQGHNSQVWDQLFERENGVFKPAPANYDIILTNIKKANER